MQLTWSNYPHPSWLLNEKGIFPLTVILYYIYEPLVWTTSPTWSCHSHPPSISLGRCLIEPSRCPELHRSSEAAMHTPYFYLSRPSFCRVDSLPWALTINTCVYVCIYSQCLELPHPPEPQPLHATLACRVEAFRDDPLPWATSPTWSCHSHPFYLSRPLSDRDKSLPWAYSPACSRHSPSPPTRPS